MAPLINHLLLPFIIAMFLAINMGGSGTGPAFSAAYGANVLRKSLIPGLFGIMVFLGAILAGKGTATTIGKELLAPEMMTRNVVAIILFSVSMSLLVANLFGIPQSTSQSTVLSVTAVAIYFDKLQTDKLLFEIIPAWFILPLNGVRPARSYVSTRPREAWITCRLLVLTSWFSWVYASPTESKLKSMEHQSIQSLS